MQQEISIVVFIIIFGTICVSYIKNKTRDLEKGLKQTEEVVKAFKAIKKFDHSVNYFHSLTFQLNLSALA